jgi:hypothetical protein
MTTPHLASMAEVTGSLQPITESYGPTRWKPRGVGLLCPKHAMSIRYLGIDIGNSHSHPPFMASLRGVIESALPARLMVSSVILSCYQDHTRQCCEGLRANDSLCGILPRCAFGKMRKVESAFPPIDSLSQSKAELNLRRWRSVRLGRRSTSPARS